MLAVVVLSVVITAILVQDAATKTRQDAVAALAYISNWWFIFSTIVLQSWGRPPLLQHLWSLAIEEQFYVIWPIVAAAVLKAWRISWS